MCTCTTNVHNYALLRSRASSLRMKPVGSVGRVVSWSKVAERESCLGSFLPWMGPSLVGLKTLTTLD